MPMFERNYENWYIWSRNGLSGPFWPPFRPKLVKMAQHHYFLASDAKSFPTRGHMPMFEQNYENWYIWSHGSSINFGRFWSIFAYFEAKYLKNGFICRPLVFCVCFVSILSHFRPSFVKIFQVVGEKMPKNHPKNARKLPVFESNFLHEDDK